MPARRISTIEHDALGVIGRKAAREIASGAREMFETRLRAIAPKALAPREGTDVTVDDVRHGTPP